MGNFFNIDRFIANIPLILPKLPVTLSIVLVSMTTGLFLGIIAALIRLNKIPVLCQITGIGISFLRGTPVIVQLFVVYFGIPFLLSTIGINATRWNKFIFVNATYALNTSAFISEIIRGSILSIDSGQREAALACGLTNFQAFKRIIAPQALLIALPSFSVSLLALLQNTSLAFTIGIVDMVGQVRAIAIRTLHVLEGYVAVAIIFVILSFFINYIFSRIEKKLRDRINAGDKK
ncbi:MAG: amino acid ABC transporter permease [Spirochaetaceae bacterium]|jgi:L-cystine transport system permease protein|nr:amino acid ABC transporter permease [Spirochaetaceae bacterium]